MQVDKPPKLDVDAYLTNLISTTPQDLHPLLESFRTLHRRKLWHQLTLAVTEFLEHPAAQPFRLDLVDRFVRDFEQRINQLALVRMAATVSRDFDNPATHLAFLSALLERISRAAAPAAYVLLLATLAHAKLLYGDLVATRADMDAAAALLDDLTPADPAVNAAYYSVAADYYKAKAEYAPYYKHSLLYLACIDPLAALPPDDRLSRAHDLAIAALLGDTIYNFGELLMHPILDALDTTPHAWLRRLLLTFNEGAIGKFEALAPLFPQEPILKENYQFLRQKICLMALIEAAFRRPQHGARTMSFRDIAHETRLPVDEVEHLLMKALSLKLIRGTLDQVAETASITWVQPRVLSRAQIGALADRLGAWCDRLKTVEVFVGQTTPELFVGA